MIRTLTQRIGAGCVTVIDNHGRLCSRLCTPCARKVCPVRRSHVAPATAGAHRKMADFRDATRPTEVGVEADITHSSRRFSPSAGKMAIAADGICYMISNSAVTSAGSRISSDFSQPGAAPRGRARTVRRRLRSYPINRLAMLSDAGSGDWPCDLAGGRSCPLHEAAKHADDQTCDRWKSRRGAPQSTHAAAQQYSSPHKVRKSRADELHVGRARAAASPNDHVSSRGDRSAGARQNAAAKMTS